MKRNKNLKYILSNLLLILLIGQILELPEIPPRPSLKKLAKLLQVDICDESKPKKGECEKQGKVNQERKNKCKKIWKQ